MSEHEWLNTEQAARMFSDQWRLRALKYEQALLEIDDEMRKYHKKKSQIMFAIETIIRAALDKPGDISQTPDV